MIKAYRSWKSKIQYLKILAYSKIFQYKITANVSATYVTLVPWRRERRRHVGGPTIWDLA